MDQSFGKEYKLCSQKIIEKIFEDNLKIKQYPFVLNYTFHELSSKKRFQIVISAPKRIFKKAHDRNRIKRLMREVIRKNKVSLEFELEKINKQMALFLIYTNKEELDFKTLEKKMVQLLDKLKITINSISPVDSKE
jgi:ribonuclease P protein component